MYCAKCGSPVKAGQTYCKSCAKKIKAAAKPPKNGRKKILIGSCAGLFATLIAVSLVFFARRQAPAVSDTPQTLDEQASLFGEASEPGASGGGLPQDASGKEASEANLAQAEDNARRKETLVQEREAKIMELGERRWMLQEAAKNLVAARLEATSFVTVEPREKFSVADVVLDNVTGNLIVSEAAKAMYRSASEGRSVQDICRSTIEEAASQIPQYLTDEAEGALQGMVTDLIGVDIFSALDFISQWKNADDMPIVLLQAIVDEQQRDVCRLALFLEQEDISAADMYKVAQLMYAIQMREQEIATVRDTWSKGSQSDFHDMRNLAKQYAANEAELLFLAQTELSEELEMPQGEGSEDLTHMQEQAQKALEVYRALGEAELGNVSVNYDVEGFREAQKTTSQAGVFGKLVAGELLGGLLEEGGQMNEDWVQENRAELCDKIADYVEESYLEVAVAEEGFMRQYGIVQDMATASGDDGCFAELYLEQTAWEEQLQKEADAYLTSLAKYLFDIDSAYILYECILTDHQADFLFELMLERDQVTAALQAVGGAEQEGYSNEEAAERWDKLLECYIRTVDQTIERGAVTGTTPALCANGSLTVYGDRTYSAYSKKFESGSMPIVIFGRWSAREAYNPRYYYDSNGNLLYVVYGNIKLTYRSNTLLSYVNVNDKMYAWDMEPDGNDMNLATSCTTKAQDMYRQFTN